MLRCNQFDDLFHTKKNQKQDPSSVDAAVFKIFDGPLYKKNKLVICDNPPL